MGEVSKSKKLMFLILFVTCSLIKIILLLFCIYFLTMLPIIFIRHMHHDGQKPMYFLCFFTLFLLAIKLTRNKDIIRGVIIGHIVAIISSDISFRYSRYLAYGFYQVVKDFEKQNIIYLLSFEFISTLLWGGWLIGGILFYMLAFFDKKYKNY